MRNYLFQRVTWLIGVVFCLSVAVSAQTATTEKTGRKPLTIATTPKAMAGKWQGTEKKEVELRGQLVFAVTSVNNDDTFVGTMIYSWSDTVREALAKQLDKPLKEIPSYVMKTGVGASWAKGASCPFLRMESQEFAFEIFGGKIHFKPVTLEFAETQAYLPQLFCHWTRQLNTRKQRRSIIAAINRALTGGEPE